MVQASEPNDDITILIFNRLTADLCSNAGFFINLKHPSSSG